jgi:hypothetical protein
VAGEENYFMWVTIYFTPTIFCTPPKFYCKPPACTAMAVSRPTCLDIFGKGGEEFVFCSCTMTNEITFQQIIQAVAMLKPYDYYTQKKQIDKQIPVHSEVRTFVFEGYYKIMFRQQMDYLYHYLNVIFLLYPDVCDETPHLKLRDLKIIYTECVEKLEAGIFKYPLTQQPIVEKYLKTTIYALYDIRVKAIVPICKTLYHYKTI